MLHSVYLETMLDVFYGPRSEFDLAQSGILWVQRKLLPQVLIQPPPLMTSREIGTNGSCAGILLNLLAICHTGVHILLADGRQSVDRVDILVLLHCATVLCTAMWTHLRGALRLRGRQIILLLFLTNPDALEGIIAGKQQPPMMIIHFEPGS